MLHSFPDLSAVRAELEKALELHQKGQLDQAAQIYQAILDQQADQADALHLLGVICLQQGQPARAVELLGRVVARQPQAAIVHARLAEAYRALGQMDRAESCCRLAIQLQPQAVELIEQLGLVLLGQGKSAAAAEQFRQVLALQPGHARAHNSLAAALQRVGRTAEALEHYRRAVELEPGLGEAHSNLGQLLLELGRADEALAPCREAVRLRPDLPAAHLNLGNVLRALGRFDETKVAYLEALRQVPNLALAMHNLGQTLHEQGQLTDAVAWFRRALQHEPTFAPFHTSLARALSDLHQLDEAIVHYRLAVGIDPSCAEAHNGLGVVLTMQGRFQDALQSLRTALELKPDLASAHANLGTVLEQLGDLAGAEASFRAALGHDPGNASARGMLASLLRGRLPDDDLAQLRHALEHPPRRADDRAALHFGLVQVLDARGDHAAAAEHAAQANRFRLEALRQRGQAYDPLEHFRHVDAIVQTFTTEFFSRFRGLGSDSDLPVFVVGFPRSGTTLVEQVLASHSRVHGAGELGLASHLFDSLPRLLNQPLSPFACLPLLNASSLHAIAQHYLDRLRQLDASAERIIDKLPDHYLDLGWIVLLFPRARIIHCRRDLRDVALSCWLTDFNQIRWASQVEHLVARLKDYQRVMAHWRRVLPVPVYEVDYEAMVADLEGTARGLVSFLGLEWEPACLEYYRSRRPVTSASLVQVRQPIYASSIGRWQRYQPYLADLFDRLQDLSRPLG